MKWSYLESHFWWVVFFWKRWKDQDQDLECIADEEHAGVGQIRIAALWGVGGNKENEPFTWIKSKRPLCINACD